MNRTATVCESCLDAIREEGAELGIELPDGALATFAREMGADIADHICDARDNGEPCGCGCRVHDRGVR